MRAALATVFDAENPVVGLKVGPHEGKAHPDGWVRVNIKAAAVENFKRKPTVVMPLDSAAAPLVFPMPGWNDKRRT